MLLQFGEVIEGIHLVQFTSDFLDHAKSKLAKSGLEAEKIAEEAHQLRIKNDINEFQLSLGALKALLIGQLQASH
jgi:hypothetical protein